MTGIVIQNCAVIDCGNDGIDVNNTNGAVIENNYVDGIYDNGIQLTSYKNDEGVTSYIRNNVLRMSVMTTAVQLMARSLFRW